MKKWSKVTIAAIELAGLEYRTTPITLEVADPSMDIRVAVTAACTEYVQTAEGSEIFRFNNACFNWGDFMLYVPNSICEKYGFHKVEHNFGDVMVFDLNDYLIDEDVLCAACNEEDG